MEEQLMLINWYKAKKAEFKVKAMFYGAIAGIIDNQKPIVEMAKNLFAELKDVPPEQLRGEFIDRVVELVHEDNKNTNEE